MTIKNGGKIIKKIMLDSNYYKLSFPLIIDFEILPNSESYEYNCISHTIGINNDISWPHTNGDYYWPVIKKTTKESFDLFYEYHGFKKASLDFSYDSRYIKVALYTNKGIPTHACIQYNDIYWESKIGSAGIIRHDLFEIENDTYGQLTQIYKKLKSVNEILCFKDFIYANQ